MTVYELSGAFILTSFCLGVLGLVDPKEHASDATGSALASYSRHRVYRFLVYAERQLIRRITPYSFVMAINLEPIYAVCGLSHLAGE